MVQIVEVQTLDGTVENVEFPSDMSAEEIEAILRREFPSQDSLAAPPDLPLALPEVDRTLSGYIEEIPKGLASGVITTAELAATGISNLLPEDQEQQARSAIAKFAEDVREPFLPDQGYEDTVVRRLSEGFGSAAAFLPTAIMGKLGLPFALGLGVAAQSGEAVRRADQAGATEEEIDKAGQLGIAPGLIEGVVPFGLGRNFLALKKAIGDGAANEIVQSLARVAVAAGAEGLQEASSEVAQNLIAQNVYDPETGTFTNTGEAFGLGAGVGGLLQGIFELVLPRSRGRTSVSPDQTAEQPIGELPTTADLSEVAVTTETPEQLVTEEVEPAPPATISPDVEEKLAEIAPKLRGTLKGRGLDDIGIELSARLNPEALRTMRDPQGVRAIFDPDTRTIMLGADRIQGFDQMELPQAQAQFAGLVDHEMVHAVKAMNLWKDSEWRVLENAARRRTNSQGVTYLQAAQDPDAYGKDSPEVQMEEAVAELMRETLAGRSGIAGQPLSLIQRMIEFLRKVGNSLTGTGFASFNQVISDVEGGVLGSRPRGDTAQVASTIMPLTPAMAARVKSNAQAQSVMPLVGGMTSEEVAAEARRQADQEARKEAAAIGIAEARAILDSSSERRASRVPSLQEQEVAMDMSFGPEGIGRLSGSEEIARRALLGRAGLTPERMQRAREQGFDTDRVLYHGTTANVLALNPKKGQAMREGVFLTTNPDSAATYGPKDPNSDAGQMLYPVLAKTERPVTIDARGQFWQDIPTRGRVTVPAADGRGQEIMTVEEFALELARDENQNALILGVEDSKGLFGTPRLESDKFSTDELLLAVQNSRSFGSGFLTKRNIDSIIFENIVDNGPVQQTGEARRRAFVPADVVVLFAPEQARSINAEFREGQELNPRLLASRASIPLTPQEEALSGREILQSGGRYDDSTARLITRPFAELLDARVQNIFGRNLADTTPQNKEIISNVMVDEALSELESEGNAVGWYKKTLEDMMDTFEQMYPVESQNPENVNIFKLALAITSNGQSVSKNTENALSIFDEYIETGKIPKRGFGDKAALMKKAFELFDNLVKGAGSRQEIFELFNREGTAKKIEEVTGKKISGENVDTVLPYSAVLGPKIGIFYQNLNGNYEPLTVDRWFMKSWGRYTGTNVPDFDKAFPARAKKLRAEIKKLPRLKGYRKDRLARDDQELMRFARERVRAYAKTRFQDKTPVNKAANNLVKAVDDVKVEPTSGGERSWIREVTNEAVDKLRKQGVDMDAATLQALLWYAEKKIYSNHGITDKKSEPTDYATEIKRIAGSRARPTGRSPDDNDRRRASRVGRAGREVELEGAQENLGRRRDIAGLEPLSGLAADKSKVAVDPEDELQADRAASEEIRKTKRMASRTPVSDIVESTAYNRVADISSKRASRGQGTVENALPFEAPSGATTDGFVYQVQDKYIDLKNATNQVKAIQKARGLTPLKDTENPYLGEESMHGIIGNKFNRFQEDEVKPLANKLVARNIPRKEFEEFLVLRHAIERNANIRKLNAASTKPRPDLVDGGAGALNGKRLLDNYVKSEMKSKYGLDWNNETQSWTGGNRRAAILNDLASDFDSITRGTLKELKDSGLISQESFDNLNTHYKYYAPLRGRSPDEDIAIEEHARLSRGANNLSIAGIETERAKGRTSESLPPLGQIITQRQNAIRRGTINDVVGQRMLNIVREFPNDSYWKIYTEPKFSSVPSKELFGVKENGKQFYIEFKDDRLREAMMSLDAAQTGKVLGIMRGVNRYLSGVLTSYNPDFIVPNFFRDIETAISNLVAEQNLPDGKALNTKGLKRAVVADTPASIKQVYRGLRGKKLDKQLEIDWKEYLESGAKTEWFHVKTPEESSRDIDDLIAMAQGTFKGNVKAGKDAIAGFVSDVNGAVENGVRFATFKKARDLFIENGVPRKEAVAQAATLAKNLTVNFNRKGNSGELLNGLYLFFNASVQGTANALRGMSSPAKQRLLASMVGFGALSAYLNELISEEDDDGNSEYSNLSSFDKERNLIIMKNVNPFYDGPADQAYKIPLPYGYNVLHVLGMYMSEVAMGLISPEQAAGRLTGAVLGSFSPIGFGEASNPVNFVAKGITPQIGKPVMEIMLNEDLFGSPVYQDNYDFGPQLPLSSLSMSSTPDFWVNTTKFLNRMTKGTDTKGGDLIDLSWVSPDALHHLFGSFIGGTGQFVERSAKTAGAARDYLQGDYVEGDLEFNDIPIIRRFNASVSDFTKKGRYYDRRDEIILTGAQVDFLEGAEKGAYIQENRPKLLMKRMLDNTDKRIRNINKKLGQIAQLILTSPSVERTIELEEAQKRLEDSKMMLINRFNKRYNEVVGRTE